MRNQQIEVFGKRLLSIKVVQAKVDMGKTKIYSEMKAGNFPLPIKRGSNSSWLESEVDEYIDKLVAGRNNEDDEL